jgi:hypothetical protein
VLWSQSDNSPLHVTGGKGEMADRGNTNNGYKYNIENYFQNLSTGYGLWFAEMASPQIE